MRDFRRPRSDFNQEIIMHFGPDQTRSFDLLSEEKMRLMPTIAKEKDVLDPRGYLSEMMLTKDKE